MDINGIGRRLLVEYRLDEAGRVLSSNVLDKTPDVSYEELARIVENEKKNFDMDAAIASLETVDSVIRLPWQMAYPVVGVAADGSKLTWNYDDVPMGMIVSGDAEARRTAVDTVSKTLAADVKFQRVAPGDEHGMLSDAMDVMMSRYEKMEAATRNNWKDMPGYGGPGAETIILAIDFDRLPFSPEVDSMLGSVARLGRAADVHLLLSVSTAQGMPGEMKSNVNMRLLLGKTDEAESARVLDDSMGARLPDGESEYGVLEVWSDVQPVRLAKTM